MKKSLQFILLASVLVIPFFGIKLSNNVQSVPSAILENKNNLSYTSHEPIFIIHDNNFTDYGIPGNGTIDNPYVIENYNITTSGSRGISIINTTKFFVIINCYTKANGDCIHIENIADNTSSIISNICRNIEDYNGVGIYLVSAMHTNVKDNICYNHGYGIAIFGSSYTIAQNNTCNHCYEGISVWSSSTVLVKNNTCNGCFNGISLGYSNSIILEYNSCNNNHFGFNIAHSSNTIIEYNTADFNYYGINLIDSIYAELTNNVCSNSVYDGIYLYTSSHGSLRKNTCNNNKNYGLSFKRKRIFF